MQNADRKPTRDPAASQPRSAPRRRLDGLQALRFIAAALVVVAHAESRLARTFPEAASQTLVFEVGDIRHWGHWGVDLFFAISGFIMFWVTRGTFQRPGAVRSFLTKRTLRIVPIYWLLTAFSVLLLAVAPSLFSYRGSMDVGWILASFAFIPWAAPEGFVAPVLGLGWTLNYEMYFYLCFALMLLLPEKRAIWVISAFFLGSATLGAFVDLGSPWGRQATSWLLLEFAAGMWVGKLYVSGLELRRPMAIVGPLALLVLAGTIFHNPAPDAAAQVDNGGRLLLWGIPSAALLLWVLVSNWSPRDSRVGRIAVVLGDASYSIYLLQVFALPGVALVFRKLGVNRWVAFDLQVLLLAAVSIGLGYVFFKCVEQPLSRRLTRGVRSAASGPVAARPVSLARVQ